MYENRNHASDSVIGTRLRQLQAEGFELRQVFKQLWHEGHVIHADGSGWVKITKAGEEYVSDFSSIGLQIEFAHEHPECV